MPIFIQYTNVVIIIIIRIIKQSRPLGFTKLKHHISNQKSTGPLVLVHRLHSDSSLYSEKRELERGKLKPNRSTLSGCCPWCLNLLNGYSAHILKDSFHETVIYSHLTVHLSIRHAILSKNTMCRCLSSIEGFSMPLLVGTARHKVVA